MCHVNLPCQGNECEPWPGSCLGHVGGGGPHHPMCVTQSSDQELNSCAYWGEECNEWGFAAAAAKSLQSCLTLCDPIDSSPPGSPVPGILQARTLEWVAISFSNAWKGKVKGKSLSRVQLFATPWTAAHQAPPSMDFPGKSTGVGCHRLFWHSNSNLN